MRKSKTKYILEREREREREEWGMKDHFFGYENKWEGTSIYRLNIGKKKRKICVARVNEPIG